MGSFGKKTAAASALDYLLMQLFKADLRVCFPFPLNLTWLRSGRFSVFFLAFVDLSANKERFGQ